MPHPDKAQDTPHPNAVESALAASQRLTIAFMGLIAEQQRTLKPGRPHRRAADEGCKTVAGCCSADLTGGRYGRRSTDVDVERL